MRIVVKVGTSTLAYPTGRLNIQRMERFCKVLSDLKNMGHEIILVSSGAIAMGFGKLNLSERPKDVPTKQASAAVGQCELMYTYDKLFTEYNHTVAQLLITAADIEAGLRKDVVKKQLELLRMRNQFDVFSSRAIISAAAEGTMLALRWDTEEEMAVLVADFADSSFRITIRDNADGQVKYSFCQE